VRVSAATRLEHLWAAREALPREAEDLPQTFCNLPRGRPMGGSERLKRNKSSWRRVMVPPGPLRLAFASAAAGGRPHRMGTVPRKASQKTAQESRHAARTSRYRARAGPDRRPGARHADDVVGDRGGRAGRAPAPEGGAVPEDGLVQDPRGV